MDIAGKRALKWGNLPKFKSLASKEILLPKLTIFIFFILILPSTIQMSVKFCDFAELYY